MLRKALVLGALALVAAPAALAAEGGCHEVSGTSVTRHHHRALYGSSFACRLSLLTGDSAGTTLTVITTPTS